MGDSLTKKKTTTTKKRQKDINDDLTIIESLFVKPHFVLFCKQGRLPVKWTAYEALLYGTYTTQSDV